MLPVASTTNATSIRGEVAVSLAPPSTAVTAGGTVAADSASAATSSDEFPRKNPMAVANNKVDMPKTNPNRCFVRRSIVASVVRVAFCGKRRQT
jgi:hypothetical protein